MVANTTRESCAVPLVFASQLKSPHGMIARNITKPYPTAAIDARGVSFENFNFGRSGWYR